MNTFLQDKIFESMKLMSINENTTEAINSAEEIFIIIPSDRRYDDLTDNDYKMFARKYGIFTTQKDCWDKIDELAPDRWDAFIPVRLSESLHENFEIEGNEDLVYDMIYISGEDLDISNIPDKLVFVDDGAFDLKNAGNSGFYTWVGYEHEGMKSEKQMEKIVLDFVKNTVIPAFKIKFNISENDIVVDNFLSTLDMIRVWVSDELINKLIHWTQVYELFSTIADVWYPNYKKIIQEVDKIYSAHEGEPIWDKAYDKWLDLDD